ncbi:hypothetical protein EVA_22403, partial [gut metagenome]
TKSSSKEDSNSGSLIVKVDIIHLDCT